MAAVVARAIFDFSSDSSSGDNFPILADDADTEESDAPTDPELGPADYWTCIKCKNQKNNPMYRFCEKCYQVNFMTNPNKFIFFCLYYCTKKKDITKILLHIFGSKFRMLSNAFN